MAIKLKLEMTVKEGGKDHLIRVRSGISNGAKLDMMSIHHRHPMAPRSMNCTNHSTATVRKSRSRSSGYRQKEKGCCLTL